MVAPLSLNNKLKFFGKKLFDEIVKSSTILEIDKDTEILKEGHYVKSIPIVIDGLLKVFTRHEDKELLLYYIQPSESCIMSFSASLSNEKSTVYAKTVEKSTLLLIPSEKVNSLTTEFPEFNILFHQQYKIRYNDLLDTINQLVFSKLDERLYHFLKECSKIKNENPVKLTHREIASELGTAREVVSRTIKKLEKENKVVQLSDSIKIL